MNLFSGEEIDFRERTPTLRKLDAEAINEKYVKGEVRIVTEQARYPLNTIVTMVGSDNYHLNPEFQRRHRWDNQKRSKLIESLLMNVPIPPIFLYEVKFSVYEVMDGLQRLTAISEFYKDKFPLEGLEEWPELNGYLYSNLPEQVKRGVDRRYLSSIILLTETAKQEGEAQKLKQLVFERINSGGTKLEGQETRNALYNGPLNQLTLRLARNPYLCRMWQIPEPSAKELASGDVDQQVLENESYRKMDDAELVLRFFAYRQFEKYEGQSLAKFLDFFLQKGNSFSPELLARYENLFNETVQFVYELLGAEAFFPYLQRSGKWIWYQRPTKVLYESIMTVLSEVLDKKDALLKKRDQFRAGLEKFYQDNSEAFEGRKVNKSDVERRRHLFQAYVASFLR